MAGAVTYAETPGLYQAIVDAGHSLWHVDGQAFADDPVAVQALINGYAGSAAELQFWRAQQSAVVDAQFAARIAAGFNYTGADGVKRAFQIDPTSQFNIDAQSNASLGAILNGESWDANSYFIAADNSHMPTPTAQAMRAFSIAAKNYVAALILNRRALKDQISAAATVAAVQAVGTTSGWPANP